MKPFPTIFLSAIFLASLASFAAPAPLTPSIRASDTPAWTGTPEKAAQELEAMWAVLDHAQTYAQNSSLNETNGISVRGVFRFALEAAGQSTSSTGWHPERVEAALRYGRTLQDRDPASKSYGNFKWVNNADSVRDYNAVEFVSQMTGLLHLQYARRLTPAAKKILEDIMTFSIEALDRHTVRMDYTNISIMKSWDYIALGEALGRPDVAEKGYARFDEWLRFTAGAGITEFGAVNYYGTDLDSLALIAKYAGRPECREKAMLVIRYLWTDAAANWWKPGDRLGCSNSRSYNYFWGHGNFETHTWTAGWLRKQPTLENPGWLPVPHDNLVVMRGHVRLPPLAEWTETLRAEIPRIVAQRTGTEPEAMAVYWAGRSVSIASSGVAHGGDDRNLCINIGATPDVTQMTLFMDGRDDPYGIKKTKNAAGQAKALHIVPFVTTVQRGPDVLQLLSSEPLAPKSRNKRGDLSCFESHLTIPAVAQVWVGENKIKPGTTETPAQITADAPIFIRVGDAVVAMRILYADSSRADAAPGKPLAVQFICDDADTPANRITIVHDTAEPKKGRASLVVWLRVADGLNENDFAKFRAGFSTANAGAKLDSGKLMTAWAPSTSGSIMKIEADVSSEKRTHLEGGEPRPALLSVNGRELGLEILGKFVK